MPKRFCEQCGTALPVDAQFCESCGVRVAAMPEAPPSSTAMPPRPSSPLFRPVTTRPTPKPMPVPSTPNAPHQPVRRTSALGLMLGALTLSLLLGAVGIWQYRRLDAPVVSSVPAESRSTPDPLQTPGRTAAELPSPDIASEAAPPIPVTDDPPDLEGLRAAVMVANARDIEALYAASPGERGPDTRVALAEAMRALAKGLYRHHVVDGHGDLEGARAELRGFLMGLEHQGLGLSDDVIEDGVAQVGP